MDDFVRLTPDEVLKLIDKQDTTELSRYLSALGFHNREEFLKAKYADQDFSVWVRYHEWLMMELLVAGVERRL